MTYVSYGTLNEETMSDFVDTQKKEFSIYQELVPKVASQLFISDNVEGHTGNTKVYKEVDIETFADLKPEGEDAKKASVASGYSKTLTFRRFAKEIDITKEMRDDNEDQVIIGKMTSLSEFIPSRMELDLTHRLTFASATTYVDRDGETIDISMGDGLALASSVHKLAASTDTYRNRVANDPLFSAGAYELAQALTTTEIKSAFGEKRVMNFNTLITTDDPNTLNEMARVTKSPTDPTQNNSGVINPYAGGVKIVSLPYLATTATGATDSTKRKIWFYAATGKGILGWQAYLAIKEPANLKTPSTGNNGEDIHNDNWTFGVRGRYGICVVSGRGIIASLPTSA